uniref:Uncharacterized protein n=1 Tax=Panagrolaimus sp. JU765 TaxID=591449 RepID=A0AC34RIJ2_9BILA
MLLNAISTTICSKNVSQMLVIVYDVTDEPVRVPAPYITYDLRGGGVAPDAARGTGSQRTSYLIPASLD